MSISPPSPSVHTSHTDHLEPLGSINLWFYRAIESLTASACKLGEQLYRVFYTLTYEAKKKRGKFCFVFHIAGESIFFLNL